MDKLAKLIRKHCILVSMESRKTIGVFSEKNDGVFSNTGAMKKTSCLLVLLLRKGGHFFLSS